MSDADFVQSAPKEELSLDQAVNQRNSESREFRVIRFRSSITMQIPHHFPALPPGEDCIEQGHESCKFHVIHFGSSSITQILFSSQSILCFLYTQLRIEIGEVNLPDLRIRIYLKVCITEVENKLIGSESVSVAINRKWY